MRLLIVEDDYRQAEWMHQKLKEALPDANLDPVTTEFEFQSRFDEIANSEPDVVVMDVMLRWTDPSPDLIPPPEEIEKEGFYRGGLRCEKMLAEDERTSGIPVVLYTVLERADLSKELPNLPQHVQYLSKQADLGPLVERIKELTRRPRDT